MPAFDDAPQGSESWHQARCSVVTASNFDCIITATGKPTSDSKSDTYMRQLLAEWYLDAPIDVMEPTFWMRRGIELEPEARELYQFITNNNVEQVGLCYKDSHKLIGASSDGLINDKGLVEIKCPKASTMISYMLEGGLPITYKQQVQGQMWVTGREWSDFFAYHPDMPPFIIRVDRDERYIKIIEELVYDFIDKMLIKRQQLEQYND